MPAKIKEEDVKQVVAIRFHPKIIKKLKQYAELNDVSYTDVITDALLNYKPIKKYFTKA